MRQLLERTQVLGVQQDLVQVVDGQLVRIVVRVRTLEQAHVGHAHPAGQLLGAGILDHVVARPQELLHS